MSNADRSYRSSEATQGAIGGGAALSGIRVVELADDYGPLCGRLLADMGAEVVKVEPPGGSASRSRPPFADSPAQDGSAISLSFAWLNSNKRSLSLDPASDDDKAILRSLLANSDVLIIDKASRLRLSEFAIPLAEDMNNPRLIVCSMSGFGDSGPHADYLCPDIIAFAMSGQMYVSGEPDQPPLVAPLQQAEQMASVTAAFGVVSALLSRERDGKGQTVEVSAQEVLAAGQHIAVNFAVNGQILPRGGSRSPIGGAAAPQGVYPCSDGHVYLFTLWKAHWRSLFEWMGSPDALADEIFDNRYFRTENADLLDTFVEDFLAKERAYDLFVRGQEEGVFIGPIVTPSEFVRDPHIQSRGWFQEVPHYALGSLTMPGMAYRMSATPLRYFRGPPSLGEANDEFLRAGLTEPAPVHRTIAHDVASHNPPLKGIRVVDFTHAVAGPTLTRLLGELGAEVIKIEARSRYQRGRAPSSERLRYAQQAATFADLNRGKRSIALDMSKEEGRSVARDLIREADVVVSNFSPRVMRRWGMDYEGLRSIREDVIGIDMPGYGLDGPYRDYIAGAVVVASLSGTYHLWDYPGEGRPAGPPAWYPDYGAGALAATAIVSALFHRQRTGQGQHIEQSQLEAVASFIAPAYIAAIENGQDPIPVGNGSDTQSPHGCYPCLGADSWCVIAVSSDRQWEALVDVMGAPEWASSKELQHAQGRLANSAAIDEHLSEWTRTFRAYQLMHRLQRAGVPAGVVQTAEDLFRDPHLWSRRYFKPLFQEATGEVYYPGPVVRMSKDPWKLGEVSNFGEDNHDVLAGLLTYSERDIEDLYRVGGLEE